MFDSSYIVALGLVLFILNVLLIVMIGPIIFATVYHSFTEVLPCATILLPNFNQNAPC